MFCKCYSSMMHKSPILLTLGKALQGKLHLSKLFASQLPVSLCPLHFSWIPLHLEILVAFTPAELENLQLYGIEPYLRSIVFHTIICHSSWFV